MVGLGTLFIVAKSIAGVAVPSPVAGAPTILVASQPEVTITWLGDTFLGDGAQPFIDEFGLLWPAAQLAPLTFGDVVIANLEGPMTDLTQPFDPMQRWSYNSAPEAGAALASMGIDAISLANNHAMDRGPEGLQDTVVNAGTAGLESFGAGTTAKEARLPLLIESDGVLIAVLGFSDDGGLKTASSDRAGVRRLSLLNLADDYKLAKSGGADRVVAAVHWGGNYTAVDPRQEAWAEAFAEAGYDLVIGTGPHIVQPIEIVGGIPIVYSLGNYAFGTPGRFNEAAQGFGLTVSTTFSAADEMTLTVRCVQTDNMLVEFQARPCEEAQADAVLAEVNPTLTITDGVGSMTVVLHAPAPRGEQQPRLSVE